MARVKVTSAYVTSRTQIIKRSNLLAKMSGLPHATSSFQFPASSTMDQLPFPGHEAKGQLNCPIDTISRDIRIQLPFFVPQN